MGPEYLLGYALGEWQSASASVVRFRNLRQDDRWTMKHAFYADMGGFALRTRDGVVFFLDSKQIAWLLEHGCISATQFEQTFLLDPKSIDDRNKSDTFVRILAIGQTLWFTINCIARGVQGLGLTTLEITTIGIIVDSVLVYYVWRYKPADIDTAVVVDSDMDLNDILIKEEDENARNQPWFRAPLDFVSREVWSFGLLHHYQMNMFKRQGRRSCSQPNSMGRRSDNDTLPVTGKLMAVGIFFGFVFIGNNFIAWNFTFPTRTERLSWRICSCGLAILSAVALTGNELGYGVHRVERMQARVRQHRADLEQCNIPGKKSTPKERALYRFKCLAMKIRNNSPEKDPSRDVSLNFVIAGLSVLVMYSSFRLFILVEDVIAFRALPQKTYATVNWPGLIPHLG